MDHQAQMAAMHGQHNMVMQMGGPHGHGQMMHMPPEMVGMPGQAAMMPSMPDQNNAKTSTTTTKKRKKSTRAQSNAASTTVQQVSHMNATMGMMDGSGMSMNGNPMMVSNPSTAIVAQNPFEDFSPSPYPTPAQMSPYGQMGQMNGMSAQMQMRPQMMHGQMMQRMPQHMAMMHGDVTGKKRLTLNVQNPNTPPVVFCGGCNKEVHESEPAVLCESGCNFWYHRLCSGLSDLAYPIIATDPYSEWCCDKCAQRGDIPVVKVRP
ncbi:hypothetical protein RvY_18120 [Ramazzottius varieornatus]|uniref:PHD-type domain-containing protein n=1 Tax=Ramazzottius varieornatus TaxID=947166 RepID=A0A1D1W4Q9_RAMVA|nr:hypothetical protein RvY_18120 [Ramazzottius varieornatus]